MESAGAAEHGRHRHPAFGGALATSTHGSGAALGAYPTLLEAIQITDGRGAVREFNRTADPDAMSAISVSLGAFGAVTQVTIRNVADYRLRRRRWTEPVAGVLERFESVMTAQRSVEFFYIPFSGQAMMLTSEVTDAAVTSRPPNTDDEALKTLRTLRNYLKRVPWLRKSLIGSAIGKLPPEDYVEAWLNVFPSERKVKFNEMEYHLPIEEGAKALREIITLLETRFPEVYFPIEVRVVAPDDIWLSPSTSGRAARSPSIMAHRKTRCHSSPRLSRSFADMAGDRIGARCTT